MKRCPTCSRTFAEPNLTFCTEDGTPLISVDASAEDLDATIVSASASQNESGSAPGANQGQATSPTDWKGPAYQPPGHFGPAPAASGRMAWSWVAGVIAVIVLALIGLGIAAAIFVPDIMKARRATNENSSRAANSNVNSNAGVADENKNTNANTNPGADTPPPENHELVLADLKKLEDEWTVANLNADRKKLAWILADDYVGMQDGVMQGKADYLRDIQADPDVNHWDFRNLKLVLNGNRATLTGMVRLANGEQDQELLLNFIDKFVWREGRWQAVASEVSPIKP